MADIVQIIMLILGSISLPVYSMVLVMFIKYRKHKPFDSKFFTLSFSLGIADILNFFSNHVFIKFPSRGWFPAGIILNNQGNWVNTLTYLSMFVFANVQHLGVLLLAFNRYTSLVETLRHDLVSLFVSLLVALLVWGILDLDKTNYKIFDISSMVSACSFYFANHKQRVRCCLQQWNWFGFCSS